MKCIHSVVISGIQPCTLIDYPDTISCIIWTGGCNFRCGYCHNPEFVLPDLLQSMKDHFLSDASVFHFLEKRKGKLDAVVFSGGEPTMHPDLPEYIRKVRKMGYLVKLDTNGNNPFMLKKLLDEELINYVAMDLKTSKEQYSHVAGCRANEEFIDMSVSLLKKSTIPYEFRSTLIKELHPDHVLQEMAEWIAGAPKMYIQEFRPSHTLDPAYAQYHPFSEEEMSKIANQFGRVVDTVEIRR